MKTLTDKLLEFQKQISVIKKDAKNPHFKNTYATLQQVLSEVKPVLNEIGLTASKISSALLYLYFPNEL